jgi:hypothetical protein
VAAASLLAGVVGPAAPVQAAEITDGLALWYKLDATSGTVAVDASANGRNGTVNGTASWSGAGEGLTFNGSDTSIKVPDNIMSGMNSITVSMDVQIDAAQATPYFLYGFGNTSNGAGNGYLFTTGNSFRTAIASGDFSTSRTPGPPSRCRARSGSTSPTPRPAQRASSPRTGWRWPATRRSPPLPVPSGPAPPRPTT